MANVATSDAVLTAFFAADGSCDKLELATGPLKASSIAKLTALQAKHTAGTDFKSSDLKHLSRIFREYCLKIK